MNNNIKKLIMFHVPVNDMQKMKEFCVDKLGFRIVTEYRQDDGHWWTSLKFPEGDVIVTLSTLYEKGSPGTMGLYLLASDIEAAHSELTAKDANPTPVANDLYGQGSGVKWFSVSDPEGNVWQVAEAEPTWAQ